VVTPDIQELKMNLEQIEKEGTITSCWKRFTSNLV
jgi:hypothetical protein